MKRLGCPKDCPDRQVGCHSNCPNYAELVKANEQRKAAQFRENQINVAVSQVQYHGLKHSMKRRNTK